PEFQPIKTHRNPSSHLAAECPGKKIRHLQSTVVDAIAAAANQSASMKDVIGQNYLLPRITSAALVLPAYVLAFSAHIHVSGRHHRFAQSVPDIHQLHPSAIPEIPRRSGKTLHFCLRIEMRVPRGEYPLLESEAIAPKCEFRYKANRQGRKSF